MDKSVSVSYDQKGGEGRGGRDLPGLGWRVEFFVIQGAIVVPPSRGTEPGFERVANRYMFLRKPDGYRRAN